MIQGNDNSPANLPVIYERELLIVPLFEFWIYLEMKVIWKLIKKSVELTQWAMIERFDTTE